MRTVSITGASSGLGRALALHAARAGDRVAISARRAEALEEVASLAPEIHTFPLDITDREAAAACVAEIEDRLGAIDLAVLNAGTYQPMTAADLDPAAFARLIDVNVMGTVNCLAPLVRAMTVRYAGHIAVVSSVAGYRGLPTAVAYGASKAALINMTEALKFDLDRTHVRLSLVNPGFVKTPLTDRNPFPMPFLMAPEAAAARLYAGLERRGFEVSFPRRFTTRLKLLRYLPYRLYFPLVARATGWSK